MRRSALVNGFARGIALLDGLSRYNYRDSMRPDGVT